ncbi:FecR family protein [Caulobacter hibisci]|uniref:DUF4880 domain-containing protein n=1 Tax=Caulobacter hibisci TaxID=2035993 RepID=A0ABS0SZY4_9CAUL|nr:DUF4880 domain-containing protein [Caulobacter hibisci]MBI1684223.1 DUF4880 domain-containing protein [Caulobacter hibisci]
MIIGEDDKLREAAASWFARLRAPGGEAARAEFEAWCAQDQARRVAYDRMVERFETSAILGHSRLAGLRMRQSPARRTSPPALWWGALAACVAAAVGLTAVLSQGRTPWSPGSDRYATAVGEIRTLTLANGVRVTLDTDSILTSHIRSGRPILSLERGRARVETPIDLAARAGQARVRASRGVFDLNRLDSDRADITLISGDIAVDAVGGPTPVRDLRLAPGQQVALERGRPSAPHAAPAASRDWPTGLLTFDAAPLDAVLAEANRYSARKIRLADPRLARLQVSGGFRVTRPEELSKALAAAFGLTLRAAPDGDYVLARNAA